MKRYNPEPVNPLLVPMSEGALSEMIQAEDGAWVKHEDAAKLIEVVRAQHEAIDVLFKKLALWAQRDGAKVFTPSKCGVPWDAAEAASKLMNELGEKL